MCLNFQALKGLLYRNLIIEERVDAQDPDSGGRQTCPNRSG